jgi:hypothetical protein
MNPYIGITYFKFLQNDFTYWLWKKLKLCKKGYHLWDEVYSYDKHCLTCDVCDLIIVIDVIDASYVEDELQMEKVKMNKENFIDPYDLELDIEKILNSVFSYGIQSTISRLEYDIDKMTDSDRQRVITILSDKMEILKSLCSELKKLK